MDGMGETFRAMSEDMGAMEADSGPSFSSLSLSLSLFSLSPLSLTILSLLSSPLLSLSLLSLIGWPQGTTCMT